MTLDPQQRQSLDEAMIEGLLPEALGASDDTDLRIQEFFQATLPGATTSPKRSRKTLGSLLAVALAASLLLTVTYGLGLWGGNGANEARAAVIRCIQVAAPAREYQIVLQRRSLLGKVRTANATLLVDGDQFVVRHPGWGLGSFWSGGDAAERWFVPVTGPALIGEQTAIAAAVARNTAESPYLHLDTILARMSKAYELEVLPDDSLDGSSRKFQRVRGRREPGVVFPRVIDLWIDRNTGIAQRVVLQWNRPKSAGILRSTIELVEGPSPGPNQFEMSAYLAPDQRVIRVDRGTDLDRLEP